MGWGGGVVVAHKILVSAPVPWIGDLGLGDWGLGLDNKSDCDLSMHPTDWWHLKELELLIQKHPHLVKIAHFSPEKIPHMNPQSMFERPLLSPE